MLDYGKSNNGYLHIFACIDIFTRKAYAVATKKKDSKSSCDALQKIIDDAGTAPKIIMSDNDSAFKSDDFQELLDKYHIVSDMNVVGDHNALGIIDNFAKRLKMALSKKIIRSKSTNTRHVHQAYRRAPSMIPRIPEETAAGKVPSPPTSAGGQERQERVNKCNGCTFDMFKSQTLLKCSDCKKECHQPCCNDKGICVICTGIKTPLPACSVCGMGDATSSCALCKKAVCPICLAGMGCCSTCLGDRPSEVIALVMDQQGRVLAFLIGFHFIFSCQSIQGRPNPRMGHPSYVPVGAGKCLRLLIVTNAYGAIIMSSGVSIALSSGKEIS